MEDNELKTLKDLTMNWIKLFNGIDSRPNIILKDIRQEAIKWVKSLEAEKINEWDVGAKVYLNAQISFIKNFFNLTEADLK